MNPYDILGVPKTASTDQIKSAYRKRARDTHPDRGGDGDKFAEVTRAYSILMDPDLRKRFDETGAVDEVNPLTIRQRMIQIIAQMFNSALAVEGERGTSLRHFPLIKAMRAQMGQNLAQAYDVAAKHKKSLDDRQFLLARISRTDDGENIFADIIRGQITQLAAIVKTADLDIQAMEMACDELMAYENEVDLIQAVQMGSHGGNFYTQNSTSQAVYFNKALDQAMIDAMMGRQRR